MDITGCTVGEISTCLLDWTVNCDTECGMMEVVMVVVTFFAAALALLLVVDTVFPLPGRDRVLTFLFGKYYTDSDSYYYAHNPFYCDCHVCTKYSHNLDQHQHRSDSAVILQCRCNRCATCPNCGQCTQTRSCGHVEHIVRTQSQLVTFRRVQQLDRDRRDLVVRQRAVLTQNQKLVDMNKEKLAKQDAIAREKQLLDSMDLH